MKKRFCWYVGKLSRSFWRILSRAAATVAAAIAFGVLDYLYDPEFFRNGTKPSPSNLVAPGEAEIQPSRIIAGSGHKTVILRFRCGPGGISEGGGIKVVPCRLVDFADKGKRAVWMFASGWGLLQNRHPRLRNYFSCRVETAGSALLEVNTIGLFPWRMALRFAGRELLRRLGIQIDPIDVLYFYLERRKIYIRIKRDRLQEGDEIILTMGDTRGGGKGWSSPKHPIAVDISVEVDERAMGRYRRLERTPVLETVGGEAVSFQAMLSSEVDGEGRLVVQALDVKGQVDANYTGEVAFSTTPGLVINGRSSFTQADSGVIRLPYEVGSSGIHKVEASAGAIKAASNPIIAGEELKLFWGDLHIHSALCDGTYDPRTFYRDARDRLGMDFAAITSHDTMERIEPSGREGEWELLKDLWEDFNEPGRFAVLLGYEWSDHKRGHRGIYFAPDEPDARVYSSLSKDSDTPEKLDRLLAEHECMIIPHHTAWRRIFLLPNNWLKFLKMKLPPSYEWLPEENERQRLAEVYSMHGSSEAYSGKFPVTHGDPGRFFPSWLRKDRSKPGYGNYIQEALAAGLRLGIIAGSDRHDYAGDERSFPMDIYSGGLTAVWADELSAESLWRSLWNRRCYGTTGARIVIEFTADGLPMGTEYFCDCPPRLQGRIIGTAAIFRAELLKHDGSGYTIAWSGGGRGKVEESFDFEDDGGQAGTFYYLRVEQEDGHCAWSSPIFLMR
ncbi:MAG: hypothetical protein A2W01_01420 [Candidatus Solincola sediminis]|nr:MAG: hypothetical protein A2W01_01420 [Candidatus Solincola sediminis]